MEFDPEVNPSHSATTASQSADPSVPLIRILFDIKQVSESPFTPLQIELCPTSDLLPDLC